MIENPFSNKLKSLSEQTVIAITTSYVAMTAEKDGYLCGTSNRNDTLLLISSASNDSNIMISTRAVSTSEWGYCCVPVRQGETLYVRGTGTNGSTRFVYFE